MLMAAETMLFTGLIGAYVVLRGSAEVWPPPDQPRLPIGVTWVNTAVLLVSCWTMRRASVALAGRAASSLFRALVQTAALGSTFLVIQGTEWVRLIRYGLTVSSGLYGATFYTLIGVHAFHVLAAVIWLIWVTARFRGRRFSLGRAAVADMCALYWYYVCGLWAILFPLVYLL